MQKSRTVCCAVIAGLIATTVAETADGFRKLTASEIKSKISGMEIEDVGEHWAEQYMRGGSLKVFAMSKFTTGKWRVQNGELCVELGPLDSGSGFRATRSSSAERDPARASKAFCRSNNHANCDD